MVGNSGPNPAKAWRDSVLRFDGNQATVTWEQDGCRFAAWTDLEPGVLGTVESLTDDALTFRTDYGRIKVDIESKKEAEKLLFKPDIQSNGSCNTLLKFLKKSWSEWGDWGVWRPQGQRPASLEPRPRWRKIYWFHPEHGHGTFNDAGLPVRGTKLQLPPEKEVA
jgi:hypothetical protein